MKIKIVCFLFLLTALNGCKSSPITPIYEERLPTTLPKEPILAGCHKWKHQDLNTMLRELKNYSEILKENGGNSIRLRT